MWAHLAETFPAHVIRAWMGDTRAIAAKHYLQVTDEHFRKAVHFPVQYQTAGPGTGMQHQPGDNARLATCNSAQKDATPSMTEGCMGWAIQDSNL